MKLGRLAIATAALLCWPGHVLAKEKKPAEEGSVTESVKKAEQYAAEAYEAYQAEDFSNAVALYLKALEASPSADILYNIAKLYDVKLKDRKLAMTFYRRYIADPGADPDRIKDTNDRLAALREAELAAGTEPEPTNADGTPVRTTGGRASTSTGTPPPPPPDEGLSGVQVSGLVLGAVGLVGIGIGTGFGLSAMADADTANQYCEGDLCTAQEGVDAAESASTAATVSTIGFTAGASLLVAGVMLAAFGGSSDPEEGDSVALQVQPVVGPYGGSLQLTGRW